MLGPGTIDEADLIPLSALQHQLYCARQCALIHVERAWAENRFTAEGRVLHERTDKPVGERRRGIRTVTAMPVRSFRLGVHGIADAVEIRNENRRLVPFPIEYKRGRPKSHRADEVQLCAQGMALEEMFGTDVAEGALFYGEPRRRTHVAFDDELRALTANVAAEARAIIFGGLTPPAVYARRKCESCSLIALCRPKLRRSQSVSAWMAAAVAD